MATSGWGPSHCLGCHMTKWRNDFIAGLNSFTELPVRLTSQHLLWGFGEGVSIQLMLWGAHLKHATLHLQPHWVRCLLGPGEMSTCLLGSQRQHRRGLAGSSPTLAAYSCVCGPCWGPRVSLESGRAGTSSGQGCRG